MAKIEKIGRFEIERLLGSGASGIVYLAHDPLIDRKVAVKTLRTDLDQESDEEIRERFLREARAAGRLSHPNIVTIFDVGEDPEHGIAFIAMEYLDGRTINERLRSGARFDPGVIVDIGATIANALGYAHDQGVVHRDIKPANILSSAQGVKITDFGIARLDTSHLTTEGTLIGTPYYMSPEQIRGRPVDGRSDLYSLGAILYQMVTGQRPFRGASLPELALNIVQQPVPDPRELCPGLPASLAGVIARCLAKNAGDRFQSGHELATALDSALDTARTTVLATEPDSASEPDFAAEQDQAQLAAPERGIAREHGTDGKPQATPLLPPPLPMARGGQPVLPGTAHGQDSGDGGPVRAGLAARLRVRWAKRAGAGLGIVAILATVAIYTALTSVAVPDPETPVAATAVEVDEVLHPTAERVQERNESVKQVAAAPQTAADPTPPAQEQPLQEPPVIPEEAESPVPEGVATLVFVHKNRLRDATISLSIDGEEVWSEPLSSKKLLRRISGDKLRHELEVPAGWRKISVSIKGKAMKVAAWSAIEVKLVANETRTLRASLLPYSSRLKLSWVD